MKRGVAFAVVAVALVGSSGRADTRQATGLIVFASDRSATLIPTEARSFDLRRRRSKRIGVVKWTGRIRSVVLAPRARAIAYRNDVGELYVTRPDGRRRLVARRLGETDDRPLWSNSGRQLAFFGRDAGRLSVYVAGARGGLRRVARRIADAPDVIRGQGLEWAPDDRRLAVVASRRGRYRLVVIDLRSLRVRRVPTGRGVPRNPDWSPDGRRIAVTSQVPGERAVIRTVDVRTGNVRVIRRAGGVPRWAPDGRSLAVDEKHSLWVIRNGVTRLVAVHAPLAEPPVWSPDSRQLAFVTGRDLIVADARRRRTRRLLRETRVFAIWSTVAWSARERVAYVAVRRDPHDLDLHVVGEDGAGARALTTTDVGETDPTWSPHGRLVAYTRGRGARGADVYAVGSDGRGARRVVADARDPSWSPDGRRLAVERGGDIWVVGVDGSAPLQLTSGPEADTSPAWSPRGDEIAFSRDPERASAEIYAVRLDGALRRITSESTNNVGCFFHAAREPAWSPDGTRLAYEVESGGSSLCGPSRRHKIEIYAAASDGTQRRFVTDGGHGSDDDDGALTPSWSPDGTHIAFVSAVHDREPEYEGRWRIAVVPAAGGPFRLITPKSYAAFAPDWR